MTRSIGGAGLLFRDHGVDVQAQALRYAGSVGGIGFVEVLDLQLLNALGHTAAEAADDVVDEALLGAGIHQAEEVARLGIVIAVAAVIVASHGAADHFLTLAERGILLRSAEAVGFVIGMRAGVAVEAHGAVAVVGGEGALRLVHRQAVVVDAEAVTGRVGIGDDARLQYFVRRIAHAGDDVAWLEGGLLDFGKIIFGIAVEFEFANFVERIILVRPNFG